MSLSDRIFRDHSCERMISYACERRETDSWSYGESSGKSSPYKSTRSISCGYELILYACNMTMFMLWTRYVEGCISRMKVACLRHAEIRMHKILEAKFIGKKSAALGCVVLVLCTCSI